MISKFRLSSTCRGLRNLLGRTERVPRQRAHDHFGSDNRQFQALADPNKIVWIRPGTVKCKMTGSKEFKSSLDGVISGNWDLETRQIETSLKFRAIIDHYSDGIQWHETDLFTQYALRLNRGELVRGCRSIDELKVSYEIEVEELYSSLRANGFLLPPENLKLEKFVPHVHIDRQGRFLFGNAGNHRFAMAVLLKIERIPCIVRARHIEWQEVRERVHAVQATGETKMLGEHLIEHPDLADILDKR